MKAARFYDRGDIRIEDIPEPKVLQAQLEFKLHGVVFAVQIYMNSWKALFLFHLVVTHIQFRENLHL
jgi:hypothetical protein